MKLEAHLFGSAEVSALEPFAAARAERELLLLLDPAPAELGGTFDGVERELRILFAGATESLDVLLLALAELRGAPAEELRSSIAPFEELLEALVLRHGFWGAVT